MVATLRRPPTAPPAIRSAVPLGRFTMVRFTRQDVEALVRLGIVPEDATTELLDGYLVHTDRAKAGDDPMSIGDDHFYCVEAFSNLRAAINGPARHDLSQQPLVCTDEHEPQPDLMVVRGAFGTVRRKPTAAEVLCVVEVADSSYERDTGVKLVGYAQAGVKQYVVVDPRNGVAEAHADPRPDGTYGSRVLVPADGTLALRVGDDGEAFAVRPAAVLP